MRECITEVAIRCDQGLCDTAIGSKNIGTGGVRTRQSIEQATVGLTKLLNQCSGAGGVGITAPLGECIAPQGTPPGTGAADYVRMQIA